MPGIWVWKAAVGLAVISHLIEIGRFEKTRFDWDSYGVLDLKKDLQTVLKGNLSGLLESVFIRFPQMMDVIKDTLNRTSTGAGISQTELCKIIESTLKTKQDACNYEQHVISSNKTLQSVCNDSNYNISLVQQQSAPFCERGLRLVRSLESNRTNETISEYVLPSNAFFLAVKVVAGTAVNAYRRKCLEIGGTFEESSFTCSKNGTKVDLKSKGDETLRTLSVVGNSISLCSLIFMIATYLKFGKHETLAGKCIICLSSALALVHALLIILSYASDVTWMCRLGATLLHYFLLMVFSWMAAIAFEFYYTFSKVRPVDQHSRQKRFKIYFGSTLSASGSVLFICLMIDIPDARYAGYGLNGTCFIAQFWTNLFAFIVPVCMVLLFNGIFLTLTILKLRAYKKSAKRSLSSGSSSDTKKEMLLSVMALKLSVLLGFGWVSGFVDASVESKTLRYIYTIIVALQGLFVLIAFGCHAEVKKALVRRRSEKDALTDMTAIQMKTV